nr:MAG TPA: hypothetical protein [Caudoviricetes sp.]
MHLTDMRWQILKELTIVDKEVAYFVIRRNELVYGVYTS